MLVDHPTLCDYFSSEPNTTWGQVVLIAAWCLLNDAVY